MRLFTVLLYFLQAALHVSDDTLIHHQEHIQTVIITSGPGRTVFLPSADVEESDSSTSADGNNTVRTVPDAVITVYLCSWWWVKVSPETCRAVCRNIIKLYIVASCWIIVDIDSRCTDRMNIKCDKYCSRSGSVLCCKAILTGYVQTHPRMFRHADGVVLLYIIYRTQCTVKIRCSPGCGS